MMTRPSSASGQGAAEPNDASPEPIAVDPSAHHAGERHPRALGVARHRGTGWPAGAEGSVGTAWPPWVQAV